MPRPFRFLGAAASPPDDSAITENPEPITISSDFVFVFTAILCALICILGLIAVARCAWLRRFSSSSADGIGSSLPPSKANKALKKKILRSLPKLIFTPESATDFADSDCVICLCEFAAGDEIRVLPHCGHAFHLACIDKWLASHSSCPSCRRILDSAAEKCDKCGNFRACSSSNSGADAEARLKHREDSANRVRRRRRSQKEKEEEGEGRKKKRRGGGRKEEGGGLATTTVAKATTTMVKAAMTNRTQSDLSSDGQETSESGERQTGHDRIWRVVDEIRPDLASRDETRPNLASSEQDTAGRRRDLAGRGWRRRPRPRVVVGR